MLKKTFKVILVVIAIGFVSVFVRGYRYNTLKNNTTTNESVIIEEESKQNIIDENIIESIKEKSYTENNDYPTWR